MKAWQDKKVLITGVCGTVGKELLSQLLLQDVGEVVGIDNNESELFFVSEEHRGSSNARFYVTDIRDIDNLRARMRGIDLVFHTAALKHVILCEHSPADAVQTNILGTQNVIRAAGRERVAKVLFTSSDKAVNPTNVMGTSKLMGERLMAAANAEQRDEVTSYTSTRFGNVLGSRGSVIPLFKRQILAGGPVTLTDPEMTRFIMSLEQAVSLVMDSALLSHGGEVLVTKMPAIRIADLAEIMIEELAPGAGFDPASLRIETIGSKPGEKLYEELLSDEETRRTIELEDYFVVIPAFKNIYASVNEDYPGMVSDRVDRPYNSSCEDKLSKEALCRYLHDNRLLEEEA